MNTKLKSIKKDLKEKGIKPTLIRLKIYEYLKQSSSHPDAQEVYEFVKKDLPVLSKTSVYNTLNLFARKKVALKLSADSEKANFDGNLKPHFHFICEKCSEVYDLKMDSDFFKREYIDRHRIKEVQGYFKGECRKCRRDKN